MNLLNILNVSLSFIFQPSPSTIYFGVSFLFLLFSSSFSILEAAFRYKVLKEDCRVFRDSFLISAIEIDVVDAKAFVVSSGPLEVVGQAPDRVSNNFAVVVPDCPSDGRQMGLQIVNSVVIIQLSIVRPTILGDHNRWAVVTVLDPVKKVLQAPRHHVQPARLCPFPRRIDGAIEIGVRPPGDAVVGVVPTRSDQPTRIIIYGHEVGRSKDELSDLVRHLGKSRPRPSFVQAFSVDLVDHDLRISAVTAEDRVREPPRVELLRLFRVERVDGFVRGITEAGVEADSNFTALRSKIFFLVQSISSSVGQQCVMSAQVVAYAARSDPGRHSTIAVAFIAKHRRLVERYPSLHAVSKVLEQNVGINPEIICDHRICPAAQVLDVLRQVPMVHRHERLDVLLQKTVDERVVVSDSLHVDFGPVGDNSRPRNRKAINFKLKLFGQLKHLRTSPQSSLTPVFLSAVMSFSYM